MTPFILKKSIKLPNESGPSEGELYDRNQQLWIDLKSGEPLVRCMQTRVQASAFGETTITETREGTDQSEAVGFTASQFGETLMTKSMEGTDQSEISHFKETIPEQEDVQSTINLSVSFHAPYYHF